MRLILPILVIIVGFCLLLDAAQDDRMRYLPAMPVTPEQRAGLKGLDEGTVDHVELQPPCTATTEPAHSPATRPADDSPRIVVETSVNRNSSSARVQ
jgi:hypothetical protein